MYSKNEEEPPLSNKVLLAKQFIRQKGKSSWAALVAVFSVSQKSMLYIYVLPALLVASSVFSNVTSSKSYAQSLSDFVTLDPKAKINAMQSIDEYSPFISESEDAEPIVTADTTSEALVLTKPNVVRTDIRPEPQPETRKSVITHEVTDGETLSQIAKKYSVRVASIEVENKDIKNIHRLAVGDSIKIPPADFSQDYIDSQLKKKTVVASVSTPANSRSVVTRDVSNERFTDSGEPAFRRPAGSLGQNGYHSWALDIPPSGGTGIYASADGVVEEVATGWNGGYGGKIVINHGSGWKTLYAHLESINVSAGQKVSAGSVIGVMGATGRTYPKGAVHLHFEIIKNGSKLNPISYVK